MHTSTTLAYDSLSKQQLIDILLARDTAVQQDIESNPFKKKYGLVWEDKPEQFDADSEGNIPVLQRDAAKSVQGDPSKPTHVLIQGDNYHALNVLAYTHERSVDVIYIDPPYNTGNKDFKYNDKFVDKEDGYRHSKWLSFMAKRLRLAKTLLKDTGAIFLSIDENEFAQLKLLCDGILGEENFVSAIIWGAGRKNDSRLISVSHEYILCYVKDITTLKSQDIRWQEKKEGLEAIYAEAKKCGDLSSSYLEGSALLKQWFKQLPDSHPSKAHKHYSWVDARGVYFPDNISWPGGGGPRYDVVHPGTGVACKVPAPGWRLSKSSMAKLLDAKRIHFGVDHTTVPCRKSYLKEHESQSPYSVIYKDGRQATKDLREILGADLFGYPKDLGVLRRILSWVSDTDAIVLDFFAGSGSTAHAVMQLNAEDGGSRQCILVTNDEGEFKDEAGNLLPGGICTNVTLPRVRKVIEGYTTPKGKEVAGLGGNLAFFKTEFVEDKALVRYRKDLISRSADLLSLKESCFTAEPDASTDKRWLSFAGGNDQRLVIVLDEFAAEDLCPALAADKRETLVYVFRFGDLDDPAREYGGAGLEHVTAKPVPDSLLSLHRRLQKQELVS
jgi:adenine-specific DNA-methyltransferase